MRRRRCSFRSSTMYEMATSARPSRFHPATRVLGIAREWGQPHTGRWSGLLLLCRDAPSISRVCRNTAVIVCSACCLWGYNQSMADSLSAARPASRLRHFTLSPTLQVVSSYAACCDHGQALASACQGLDPDPMWLRPVDAAFFLSAVAALIWFF